MPNWCENDLYVRGAEDDLARFKETMRGRNSHGEETLLNEEAIIPYPEHFRKLDEVARQYYESHPDDRLNAPKDGFNQGGYEWCIQNWGTKWGFCNVELVSEGGDELQYTFNTAWSPPTPLIKKLGEIFPTLEFELRYFEGLMGFNGILRMVGGQVEEDESGRYFGDRGG